MSDRPIKRPPAQRNQQRRNTPPPRRSPYREGYNGGSNGERDVRRPPSRSAPARGNTPYRNGSGRGNSNGRRPPQRRRRRARRSRSGPVMLFCIFAAFACVVIAVVGLVGSMAGPDTPTANAATGTNPPLIPPVTPSPEPTPDPMEGLAFSPFNGFPIPEELALVRPVAVIINNHSRALPQSGLSDADIIYEVLSEGPITRLVTIHHLMETEKVGPVRSVRDYFVDFTVNHGAIVAHHGGSDGGYGRLRSLEINALDGVRLEGSVFWRDPTRANTPGMLEHSSYTNTERIDVAIDRLYFPRQRPVTSRVGYNFNQEDVSFETIARASGGVFGSAVEITVPFSREYPRRFVFDEETQTYAVYGMREPRPHMDEETGEQVRVTNVLVQYVSMWVIPGDNEGRREVITTGSGSGHLITEGGIVNVRWTRESHSTPTRWYFINGTPMTLTPGNTWVNVLSVSDEITIVGIEEEEEFESAIGQIE